jgi:hypothetical protein
MLKFSQGLFFKPHYVLLQSSQYGGPGQVDGTTTPTPGATRLSDQKKRATSKPDDPYSKEDRVAMKPFFGFFAKKA